MLPKVAAITMVYNEALLLPVWARHYARQVGADYCYVVDHGSTEPVVLPPGVNTIRLPRSAHDDTLRTAFMSDLVRGLLRYYDWVLYTDVDELLLADPERFAHIPQFCASAAASTISAIGLDVQHVPAVEPRLNMTGPIGAQRAWVRFTSAMCKPVLTRQPVTWAPGFHCCEQPLAFDRLFLFHLHWADLTLGLQRLEKTRSMSWSGDGVGNHQRIANQSWLELFHGMANFPRSQPMHLDPDASPLKDWLSRTEQSAAGRAGQAYTIDLGINAAELWPIPPHFRARL